MCAAVTRSAPPQDRTPFIPDEHFVETRSCVRFSILSSAFLSLSLNRPRHLARQPIDSHSAEKQKNADVEREKRADRSRIFHFVTHYSLRSLVVRLVTSPGIVIPFQSDPGPRSARGSVAAGCGS